jgi:hypothetical protein
VTLAGYSANGRPLRHSHVQSIDLSHAGVPGMTELNHDVFASNPVMSEDMRQVFQHGSEHRPDQRLSVLKCRGGEAGGIPYWVYDPKSDAPGACPR